MCSSPLTSARLPSSNRLSFSTFVEVCSGMQFSAGQMLLGWWPHDIGPEERPAASSCAADLSKHKGREASRHALSQGCTCC